MTQVRCVAYLDYLVPVMAGISHQAASLPHPLSENWPFLCTMCYNGAGWSLLWPRTDTALQPALGNVMKHTLETDHMDMWIRYKKGCIMHIHERDVFNNTTTQNFKTTFENSKMALDWLDYSYSLVGEKCCRYHILRWSWDKFWSCLILGGVSS